MLSPPGGPGSEREQGSSTHQACAYTRTRDELLLGTWLGWVCTRTRQAEQNGGGRVPRCSPVTRRGPALLLLPHPGCTGAVLAPQDLWGHTLNRYGRQAGPSSCSLSSQHVTGKGHTLYHTLLPDSRVPYGSNPPTQGLVTAAPPHAQMASLELVELCWGYPAPGIRLTFGTQQHVRSGQVLWEHLHPAVQRAACRGSGEGAGSRSPALAARARQGRRALARQGSKDQAVTWCCQDATADASAQQFPMPRG